MKNQICYLTFFLFSLSPFFSSAQTFLGLKGQINDMGAPLVIKRDLLSKSLRPILNPGFGIYCEFRINDQWSFQPEVNYQEQRKNFLLTGNEKKINTSILEYIRVPLLVNYTIPFKKWNLIGFIGPSMGYAFRLKSGETDQNYTVTEFIVLDFDEHQIRQIDFGFVGGVGIEKLIANKLKTRLSLRYHAGILDIMKDPQSTFRTSGYVLDMGFMIPFRLLVPDKDAKKKNN